MSHWSSGLPICFPVMRDLGSYPLGVLMWNWDSPVSLSRYIGDPDLIDHCGLVWGGLRPEPSLGPCADNVIIPLDLTALLSQFHPCCRSSFWLHNHKSAAGGSPVEILQSHCIHTMSHWSSGLPICFPSWGTWVQSPGGYLCETRILLLVLSRYNPVFILFFFDGTSRTYLIFLTKNHIIFIILLWLVTHRSLSTHGLVCRVPKPKLTWDMVRQTQQKSTNPWANDHQSTSLTLRCRLWRQHSIFICHAGSLFNAIFLSVKLIVTCFFIIKVHIVEAYFSSLLSSCTQQHLLSTHSVLYSPSIYAAMYSE
jgi:hypothetical protein